MVTLTGSPGEAARLAALRASLAPGTPLVAVAERRANLDPATVAACDAVLTPRLAGDPDPAALAAAAALLAGRVARGEVRPTLAAVFLPLAVADTAPFRDLDLFADDQLAMPLVLGNGIVLGGQGEVKDWGVTVVVVTDFDIAYARNLADDLAEAVWERRVALAGDGPGGNEPGRRRPLWPFEPAEWAGVTFGT